MSSDKFAQSGFPRVTSNEISRPFPDKVPIFTDFLQHENIFWPSLEFTWVTKMKKKLLQRLFVKKTMFDLSFYVLYQLNHNIIYKRQIIWKYVSRFSCISCWQLWDWATTSWHWQSKFEMRPSYWYQLHFSWLFGEFKNFLAHIKIYWLFPDFLRF